MKNKSFNYTLLILFIMFLALYFSSNFGLIDYQSRRKKELTEAQIKQFEEDIKNNVNVDIKEYIDTNDEEYDNNLSKTTLKISNTIGETIKGTLDFFFKKLEKAMNN